MRKLLAIATMLAVVVPVPLSAQDIPAFEVNMQRVRFAGPKNCAPTRTYIVPTVQLYVQARNTSWARNGGAEAKASGDVTGPLKVPTVTAEYAVPYLAHARMGARVDKRIYPGMGHLVNDDEIAAARKILDAMIA